MVKWREARRQLAGERIIEFAVIRRPRLAGYDGC